MCSAACSDWVRLDLFAPDSSARDAEQDAAPREDSGALDAAQAPANLILRYDFAGRGTTLVDRVGNASARVLGGAELDGAGGLTLDGVDDYVDLPNRTLASLQSATVMTWVSWFGGTCWQRAFDFGRNSVGEGQQGLAQASLFVAFSSCPEGTLTAFFEQPPEQYKIDAALVAKTDAFMQLTLVFDAKRSRMTFYLDQLLLGESDVPYALSELADDNAWLGRSQWQQDSFAHVRYEEFRIYDRALTAVEVGEAYTRGPNAP